MIEPVYSFRPPRSPQHPAYVYRVFTDDDLIYVGQTIQLRTRLSTHKRHSWWSETATKVRAIVAPNVATARTWETRAILDEVPRWNFTIVPLDNDVVFADFVERWLINERNTRDWYRNNLNSKPMALGGPKAYERLFRRYRLRHGREFDRSLLSSRYEAAA